MKNNSPYYVYLRVAHHSGASGYDRFVKYLDGNEIYSNSKRWPGNVISKKINTLIALLTGAPWYTKAALSLELRAFAKALLVKDQIFHFLYGDTDLHLLYNFRGLNDNKIIASYHQPPEELVKGVSIRTLQKLSSIVVVSTSQIDFFANYMPRDRIFFVPHGIDTKFYQPPPLKLVDTPIIISVGSHLRDFATLANAARIILKEEKTAQFIIVTRQENQKFFAGNENVTIKTGISDLELQKLYSQATISILPLSDCTANNAVLESISSGLPTIVTDVGGIRDYVDESCVLLVHPNDAEKLASSAIKLIHDNSLRASLSLAARQRAEQLDFSCIAKQMLNVYQAVRQFD